MFSIFSTISTSVSSMQTTQMITGAMRRSRSYDLEPRPAPKPRVSNAPRPRPAPAKVDAEATATQSDRDSTTERRPKVLQQQLDREISAVQSRAYALAKLATTTSQKSELLQPMRDAMLAQAKSESGLYAHNLRKSAFRISSSTFEKTDARAERSREPVFSLGFIENDEQRKSALTAHEAHRLARLMGDRSVTHLSERYTNEARGDDRRLDTAKLAKNMSALLTGYLLAEREDCARRRDKEGAAFPNAALNYLAPDSERPASLKAMAQIARRASAIFEDKNPDIAASLAAAQLSLHHGEMLERAKASRANRSERL